MTVLPHEGTNTDRFSNLRGDLQNQLNDAIQKVRAAQADVDKARNRGTRWDQEAAQNKPNAAVKARMNVEDKKRAKESELKTLPQEKARTLADIRQLCDKPPGDDGFCPGVMTECR